MRKIINRFLFIIVGFFILFYFINPIEFYKSFKEKITQTKIVDENLGISTVYILSDKDWLTFSIQSFSQSMKFITTANILNETPLESLNNIRYAIVYEFIGLNGEVIDKKVYNFKASLGQTCDKDQNQIKKSFYSENSFDVATDESIFISLANYSNIAKIRMKIESKDTNIVDVGIRSYQLEKTSDQRKDLTWERMLRDKKEFLARGNIYDIDFLSQEEKDSLVSSLWKPIGPLGNENEDYKIRKLYSLDDLTQIYPCTKILPSLFADENIYFSRYFKKGKYDISLVSTNSENKDISIKLREFSGSIMKYENSYVLKDKKIDIPLDIKEDTIVEIESTKNVAIYLKEPDDLNSLSLPSTISSDYYKIDETQGLSYSFFSNNKRYIRVECRANKENLNAKLTIKMKDENGDIIKILNKDLEFVLSKYDYIKPFIPQSEALYIYLSLDENVKSIDFSSNKTMIIKTSTRSDNFSYPVYSFNESTQSDYSKLSGWFSIRANDFNSVNMKDRAVSLYKQIQHPIVNEYIQTGDYNFEQLFPTNSWQAYEMLMLRPLEELYIQSQGWSGIYSKLSNKNNTLVFKADVGLKDVSPRLIYQKKEAFKNKADKTKVSVFLDNVGIINSPLFLNSGTINLPFIDLKKSHTLNFENANQYDFFISNTDSSKPIHIKKQFLLLDKPLNFTFEKKKDEESLGFQIATIKREDKTPLSFKIVINKKDEEKDFYNSFTFKNYELFFDTSSLEVINVTKNGEVLTLSESSFLTLGENLKAGKYNITIYPIKNSEKTYLYINHLIPNLKSNIRISKEKI